MKLYVMDDHSCVFNFTSTFIHCEASERNYEICEDPGEADIIIFPNCCSGALCAIDKTLHNIREVLLRKNPTAITCMTGCLTRCITNIEANPDQRTRRYFSEIKEWLEESIDYVFSDYDLNEMLKVIFNDNSRYEGKIYGVNFCYGNNRDTNIRDIHMYISKGCLNRCAFCKSTYQDFRLASVSYESIIEKIDRANEEFENLRISLIGPNISQYGIDIYGESKLSDIIEHMESKPSISEVELIGLAFKDSIQNPRLTETLKNSRKVSLISGGLESGSDRILSLMNKGYTRQEILDFFTYIQSENKKKLDLNIIAGLPTEERQDIESTMNLLTRLDPYKVNVIRYADSPFVAAHKYPQLNDEEKREHARIYSKCLKKRGIPYLIA